MGNTETNKVITKNLLDNIAKLTDGRWYQTETLNSRGERTRKYIVEYDITEEPDSSSADASGSDSSNSQCYCCRIHTWKHARRGSLQIYHQLHMNLTPSEAKYLRDILKKAPLDEEDDHSTVKHERLQRKLEDYLVRLRW